jgi:ABC-type uncharacterized transport system substrate-binding protein
VASFNRPGGNVTGVSFSGSALGTKRLGLLGELIPNLATVAYFMHYNFVRIHQTLKISPAMAAGVTDKLWEMSDMVKVLEDWENTT